MNVNCLAISIGNTRTRLGAFTQGKLHERQFLANNSLAALDVVLEQIYAPLRESPDAAIVIASVNPKLTDSISRAVTLKLEKTPLRIERDMKIPIGRQLDPESIVGEDRLLNAAAAYDTLKQACVVIDAGTAITVDFIDGVGTFHGGAIAPGAQMMLDALHNGTAQLPEVEMDRPEEAIGHNTTEAMLSGVFHGLRGLVHELTEQFAEVAGSFPLVIATGGDAEVLFEGYELVDRIVPDLTLLGIAITYQHYLDAAQEEDQEGQEEA